MCNINVNVKHIIFLDFDTNLKKNKKIFPLG